MLRFLACCVRGRANVIVSGGAGTGKTTMLGILSASIPDDERLITIEDAAELRLAKPHVVSLEARPANVEGRGEVTVRDLVRNALRMRPDRIIVGEVRGGEALDMLQAMNTGHEGSLSTAHANSTRHLLWRLETMAMMSDVDLPGAHIRTQVCSAVDVIVHLARLRGGRRVVWEIAAVEGTHRGEPVVTPLYRFQRKGSAAGSFEATGAIPEVLATLANRGEQVRIRTLRGGSRSMIAVPAAALVVAGVMAAAAVRHVERADVHHRIAPIAAGEPRRRAPLAIPGIGWPWWPVVGAVVGYAVGGAVAALIGARRREGRSDRLPPTRRRPAQGRPR